MKKELVNSSNTIKDEWQDIADEDISDVLNYLKTADLSVIDGGVLTKFEQSFASYIGAKYAVAYCNGTGALHAAAFACGASEGKEFITSIYSYHGTVISLLEHRCNVKLVDFEKDFLTIDLDEVEKHISKNTIGIMVTHCWGNLVDYEKLNYLKNKYNLKVIVDASHAHGSEFNGVKVGNIPCEDIVCFSLGKRKLMSAGELGIAVTNNYDLYQKLLFFGHPNRVPDALDKNSEYRNYINGIGNKFRPHALALVLGINQLKKFPQKIELNKELNNYLSDEINKIDGFYTLKNHNGCSRVYWKLQVFIDEEYWKGIPNEKIINSLKAEGLSLEQFHNYNLSENLKIWSHERYGNLVDNKAKVESPNNIIVLPGYIKLSKENINLIINAFKKVSKNRRKLQ